MATNNMDIVLSLKQQGAGVVNSIKNQLTGLKKLTDSISLGQIAGAVGVVRSMGKYLSAYDEQRRAVSTLSNSLKNIGMDYESVRGEVEKTTAALQGKTNFGDEEQIRALARLVPLVGSYEKSMKTLPQILDLAAFQQSDLTTATDDYAKLLKGELPRGLARVLPELTKMKEAGAGAGEMMAFVAERTKGVAEADASPLIQLQNTLGDIAEEIGKVLLPVVKTLKDILQGMPSILQKIIVIAPAVAGAFMVMGGPVTMVAGAVGLLVIGMSNLYQSFKQNEKAWQDTQAGLNNIANEAKLAGVRVNGAANHVFDFGIKADLASANVEDLANAMIKAGKSEAEIEAMRKQWRAAKGMSTKEDLKLDKDALKQKLENEKYFAEKQIEYKNNLDNYLIDKRIEADERERQRQSEMLANMQKAKDIAQRMDEDAVESAQTTAIQMSLVAQSIGMALSTGIGQGAEGARESLKALLNLSLDFLQNKLLTATASAIFDGIMSLGATIPAHVAALAAGTVAIQAARAGISKFEAGTNYAPGGLSLVGERGPELVNLPRGSQVMNNTQTYQSVYNNAAPNIIVLKGNGNSLNNQLKKATRNRSIDWNKYLQMA
jgi:hypothetical protein